MKLHLARVVDDTHRDENGALVPDGGLRLQCPTLAGDNGIGWIQPFMHGVFVIPKGDAVVVLYELPNGRLKWGPEDNEATLPTWFRAGYPGRNGI